MRVAPGAIQDNESVKQAKQHAFAMEQQRQQAEEQGQLFQRLSDMTGNQYQLPSEAQWEYACRFGLGFF